MTAQGADGEALVVQFLLELLQFLLVLEHGELAMRIAGIVAGAQFNRVDVQALQLFENFVERELGQQGGKTSNSHDCGSLLATFCDSLWAEYHASMRLSARAGIDR